MRLLEFNEDDYRDLELSEEEEIEYQIDKNRIDTLTNFLGYEIKTDGDKVYAVGNGDVVEIGLLNKS